MTSQNDQPAASLCDAARDFLPAYTAGIADAEERALVERGLAQCPDLAADLAAYTRLAEGMLLMHAPVAAPAHLRSKILLAAGGAASPVAPTPAKSEPGSFLRRWLERFFNPTLKLRPALAFAALVLFVGTNVFWWAQLQQQERRTIENTLLNYIGSGEGAATQVNFQAEADAPEASLLYSRSEMSDSWIGLFSVSKLPALQPGQTYQGWLMRENDAPLSIGVFDIDENGTGILIFEIGEPITGYEQVGVTAEPEGGSEGPTTNPVLAGQL
jgi:hypothetical protein